VETTPPLRAVPAAAAAALPRHVPDVDNTVFTIWDLGFKIVNRTSYIKFLFR